MPTRRQQRVAEQIHRELSSLLLFEARDPRLSAVTITGVDITQDLMFTRVFFTALGTDEEQAEALAGLRRGAGFLRTQLAGRLKLRFMPELVFEVDKSAAYARRIDQLLDQLEEGDQDQDEPGPA